MAPTLSFSGGKYDRYSWRENKKAVICVCVHAALCRPAATCRPRSQVFTRFVFFVRVAFDCKRVFFFFFGGGGGWLGFWCVRYYAEFASVSREEGVGEKKNLCLIVDKSEAKIKGVLRLGFEGKNTDHDFIAGSICKYLMIVRQWPE